MELINKIGPRFRILWQTVNFPRQRPQIIVCISRSQQSPSFTRVEKECLSWQEVSSYFQRILFIVCWFEQVFVPCPSCSVDEVRATCWLHFILDTPFMNTVVWFHLSQLCWPVLAPLFLILQRIIITFLLKVNSSVIYESWLQGIDTNTFTRKPGFLTSLWY